MNLSEAIESEPKRGGQGPACWVLRAQVFFDEDDFNQLMALLEEVRQGVRTAASVGRIGTKAGFKLSGNQVTYHMRNECNCRRDDDE